MGVQGFIARLSMGSDALMEFHAKGDIKDCPILLTVKLTHVCAVTAVLNNHADRTPGRYYCYGWF